MIGTNLIESSKMLMLKVSNRHLPDTFWDIHLPNEMWNEIFAYVGGVGRHPVAKLFWERIYLRNSDYIWERFYRHSEEDFESDDIRLDNALSLRSRFSEDGYKYSLSNYERETGCFLLNCKAILSNGYCYDTNDDNDIIWIKCDKNHKLGKNVFYYFIEDGIIYED
jgi:hypothetical protein